MKRVGVVLALVLLAGAAWLLRDDVARLLGGGEPVAAISPETAALAAAKLERLSERGETARLSGDELTSLIRFRMRDRVPQSLREPMVTLRGDTLRLSGTLPTDQLPPVRELERVRAFLPDTAQVEVAGRLEPLNGGRAAFDIARVSVSGVPIPAHFYPTALERLGRRPEPDLAPTAVPIRLPAGVGEARVEGGELVLSPPQP